MKRNVLQPFLQESGAVILDGALATELERRGADLADPLWSAKVLMDAPDLIRQVHHDYFAAGADVAITSTYQATFAGFARRGISSYEAIGLMRRSVQLACEARDQFWAEPANRRHRVRPLVAASIGPYGAYLADGSEYRGDYGLSATALQDFHRSRLAVLVDTDADLLACETIPSQLEAEALIALLGEFPQAVAWLSFSCCDSAHVCHGEPLATCAALAANEQIVAMGVNCTRPEFVTDLLQHARKATDKPLLAYPNSGEGWDSEAKCWLPTDEAVSYGVLAGQWRKAGAQIIGGCCRTTPADIAAVRATLAPVPVTWPSNPPPDPGASHRRGRARNSRR